MIKDSWEQSYFVLLQKGSHSATVYRIKCLTCSPLKGTMVIRAISLVVL